METNRSLSGISLEKQVFATKLAEIEMQLATSVQTQVVETNRALELLESSCKDIKKILANFEFIDSKSKECKQTLNSFADIKLLSLARNNLRMTKEIQRLFREIPDRAMELKEMLETDSDMYMVPVYRNLRRLIRLRDEALKKSKEFDTLDISKFNSVENVALLLENQIRENVDDTLYLAKAQPYVLVNTLKICEMEDRYGKNEKILKANSDMWRQWRENGFDMGDEKINNSNSSSNNNNNKSKNKNKNRGETMKSKVRNEILDLIFELISTLTEQTNANSEDMSPDATSGGGASSDQTTQVVSNKEFLKRVDLVMADLQVVIEDAKYCFPPSYGILSYYVDNYQRQLTPLILDRIVPSSVPTQERLSVVSWLAKFKKLLENLDIALQEDETERLGLTLDHQSTLKRNVKVVQQRSGQLINHVVDCEKDLLQSYIDACRSKLEKWIENIIDNEKKEEKIFWTKNNIPKTHSPQDLFTALNHQFDVAMEQLRDEPFVKVINMILKSIDHFRDKLSDFIFAGQRGGGSGGKSGLNDNMFSDSDSEDGGGGGGQGQKTKKLARIRGSIQIHSGSQNNKIEKYGSMSGTGDGKLSAPGRGGGGGGGDGDDGDGTGSDDEIIDVESRSDEYICAIINSCYDISEKLRMKGEEIIDADGLITSSKSTLIDELDEAFDDRVCRFTSMATNCVLNLAKYEIFGEALNPNVFIKLFTKEWLLDEECEIAQNLILTLEDYFGDLKGWIEESHFFWEMVKFICDNIYKTYYKQFLKRKPKSMNPDLIGKRITGDLQVLDYFILEKLDNEVIRKYWNEDGHKRLQAFGGAMQAELGFIGGFQQNVIAPNTASHHHGSVATESSSNNRKRNKKTLGEKVWHLVKSIKEKQAAKQNDQNGGDGTGGGTKKNYRKFLDKMNT